MNHKTLLAVLVGALVAGCATPAPQPPPAAEAGARSVEVLDDAVLTTRVNEALAAAPELNQTKIDVDTRDARVSLRGEIKSMALRKKAEAIVRTVPGVRAVDNQLIITG